MERTLCLTPCDLQSMMRAMLADDDKYDSVLDHHTANMHVAPDILGDVESNVQEMRLQVDSESNGDFGIGMFD